MILDYVNLGLHLEVAIPVARDAAVQRALQDRAGYDALSTALYFSGIFTEEGQMMQTMKETSTHNYVALLQARRRQAELEARDAAADR